MKHTIDDILLQRCVDGELTDNERAELLRKLNEQGSIENWKTLALSFVEHQVFSKVFADGTSSGELLSFQLARPVPPSQNPDRPVPIHWLHRRVRPWFSLATSLLVGMTVGVGGHFWMAADEDGNPNLARLIPVSVSDGTGPAASHVRTAQQTPMMNVRLTGLGNRGAEPVSIPVYSPEQWEELQQSQQAVQMPDELRRYLEAQGMTVDHERQWYRAPLDDGREILVPTETMRVRHAVQ